MMQDLYDAMKWFLTTSLPPAAVLAILGYLFREKWRQVLKRSLATDLEILKHDLVKAQAEHAASLAPQLELIKHDFQQKLEAYKVSLIAQAEEVKIRGDVKKSIATRYVEIKFERMVALEKALAKTGTKIMSLICYPEAIRNPNQVNDALECFTTLSERASESDMFLTSNERIALFGWVGTLSGLLSSIGPGKAPFTMEGREWLIKAEERVKVEAMIRQKIHEQASL